MSSEKWLIDANVFESDIKKMFVPYGDGTYPSDKNAMIYDEALVDVLETLNKASIVDAVEVVRCKDCKYRRIDEDYANGHYCVKRPSNGGYFCEDNDFCSYGERREGE